MGTPLWGENRPGARGPITWCRKRSSSSLATSNYCARSTAQAVVHNRMRNGFEPDARVELLPVPRASRVLLMSAVNFDNDCVVVGASFAGLACATSLARAGYRVRVWDKKSERGEQSTTPAM